MRPDPSPASDPPGPRPPPSRPAPSPGRGEPGGSRSEPPGPSPPPPRSRGSTAGHAAGDRPARAAAECARTRARAATGARHTAGHPAADHAAETGLRATAGCRAACAARADPTRSAATARSDLRARDHGRADGRHACARCRARRAGSRGRTCARRSARDRRAGNARGAAKARPDRAAVTRARRRHRRAGEVVDVPLRTGAGVGDLRRWGRRGLDARERDDRGAGLLLVGAQRGDGGRIVGAVRLSRCVVVGSEVAEEGHRVEGRNGRRRARRVVPPPRPRVVPVDVAAHELEGFAVAADGLTRDPVARARVMAPVGGALEGGPGVGRRIARPVGAEIAQCGAHGGVRVGVERGRPGHEFAGGLHSRKARRILEPRELLLERCAPVDVVVVPDLGHVRRVCRGRDRSWAFGETPQPPALAKIVCIANSAALRAFWHAIS